MPDLHRVCLFSANTKLWAFGKQHAELWRVVQLPDGLHERGVALGAALVWLGAMRHVIKCLDLGHQGQTGSLALLGALVGGSVETLALTFELGTFYTSALLLPRLRELTVCGGSEVTKVCVGGPTALS